MGLIAIGDIHGCAATLDELLDVLSPGQDDHLVFVGDYIDRGPDSRAVIDGLLSLRERVQCSFLRGNHEALMLNYLDHGEFDLWRMNGGVTTLDSYSTVDGRIKIPDDHVTFIRQTGLFLDTPEFFFVHGGIPPNQTVADALEDADERVLLWERDHLDASRRVWEKTIVCGHTPHPDPIDQERLIMIDTGCVYRHHPGLGRLTAVRLPQREFVSVPYVG